MNIVILTSSPFGLRGTAGTYLGASALNESNDLVVVCPPRRRHADKIVFDDPGIALIEVAGLHTFAGAAEVVSQLRRFRPQLIYVLNNWHAFGIYKRLSAAYPKAKWVLDIRTPLLPAWRDRFRVQRSYFFFQFYLDAIVTLTRSSVKTWIPLCFRKSTEIPLSMDRSSFSVRDLSGSCIQCRKFVFVGTLHPIRQLDFLIYAFAQLKERTEEKIELDIFGNGPDEDKLKRLVESLGLSDTIRFRGLTPQKKLASSLSAYDVGIAYVPKKRFDDSPSLKSIEYTAAGLVVLASNTRAHKRYEKTGLGFEFFRNTKRSFVKTGLRLIQTDYPTSKVKANLAASEKYDYKAVVEQHIEPVLERVIKS